MAERKAICECCEEMSSHLKFRETRTESGKTRLKRGNGFKFPAMTDPGYMIGSHVIATEAPGWQGAMTGRSSYRFAVKLADAWEWT